MTIKTIPILLLMGLFSLCIVHGQQNDSLKANATILNRIDSLVSKIENHQNCFERISEGRLMNDNKMIGGFSTYYLRDKTTNKMLRIRDESSIDFYYKTTFFYDVDKIIFATVVIEDWNFSDNFKVIYSAKYYFKNDILILAIDEDKKYSTSSDILVKGQKYLQK